MKRSLILAPLLLWASGTFAAPVTMQLVSFNGVWQNGYPYIVTVDNGFQTPALCDDYNHDGKPGDMWQANLTNLGTGNLTYLRFSSFGLTNYQEVAWILLQTLVTSSTQYSDMNYAVWHIFYPSLQLTPPQQYWVDQAIIAAQNNFYGDTFDNIEIATPVQINALPTGDQEFLWITPEPGSLILLGTGALGTFAVLRRNRKN